MLHSYYLDSFFDFTETIKPDLVYLEYSKNDYDIMDQIIILPDINPSNQELRLALELIDFEYPLFKSLPNEDKADALRDVFHMNIPKKRLKQLRNHKQILFKQIILINNNKPEIKRVIKF